MRSWLSLAVVLAAVLSGCGQTSAPCGPSTCAGCCTSGGECVLAPSAVACGGSGSLCSACTPGQTCVSGLCTSAATGGGSAGTGGGTATGGGGGATGGGGGGSTSSNSVTGTPGGQAMQIVGGAAQQLVGSTDALAIRLSESTPVCSSTGGFGLAKSGHRLVDLFIPVVRTGSQVARLIQVIAPNCSQNLSSSHGTYNPFTTVESSQSISVNLTNVTGRVQGTFSGTLTSGGLISGTIDVDYCTFLIVGTYGANCVF